MASNPWQTSSNRKEALREAGMQIGAHPFPSFLRAEWKGSDLHVHIPSRHIGKETQSNVIVHWDHFSLPAAFSKENRWNVLELEFESGHLLKTRSIGRQIMWESKKWESQVHCRQHGKSCTYQLLSFDNLCSFCAWSFPSADHSRETCLHAANRTFLSLMRTDTRIKEENCFHTIMTAENFQQSLSFIERYSSLGIQRRSHFRLWTSHHHPPQSEENSKTWRTMGDSKCNGKGSLWKKQCIPGRVSGNGTFCIPNPAIRPKDCVFPREPNQHDQHMKWASHNKHEGKCTMKTNIRIS